MASNLASASPLSLLKHSFRDLHTTSMDRLPAAFAAAPAQLGMPDSTSQLTELAKQLSSQYDYNNDLLGQIQVRSTTLHVAEVNGSADPHCPSLVSIGLVERDSNALPIKRDVLAYFVSPPLLTAEIHSPVPLHAPKLGT